jgi:hypothetical protein
MCTLRQDLVNISKLVYHVNGFYQYELLGTFSSFLPRTESISLKVLKLTQKRTPHSTYTPLYVIYWLKQPQRTDNLRLLRLRLLVHLTEAVIFA